jgi:acetoacetate decarboxylase
MPTSCAVKARAIKRFGSTADSEPCQIFRITKTSDAAGVPIDREAIAESVVAALGAGHVTLFDRVIPRVVAKVQRASTEAERAFYERRPLGTKQWNSNHSTTAVTSLADQLKAHSVPMLFLKQFRDITYADRACYQAILEASFELKNATEGSFATGYELSLENVDSVPIGRELGIPTGEPVQVAFGFRIALDEMRLSRAEVISNPYWNPGVEFSTSEEPSRLPMYVDRGGEAVWRQPSKLYDARIFGFGVRVPADQQQALLKTFVNDIVDKSDSTYGSKKLVLQPCDLVDLVMLLFVDYKRITSGDPNDSKLGGTTYREFLLMQLAISDDAEFPELDWFIPYICLDADAPRLGGREIFGYPKQLAKITEFDSFGSPSDTSAPARNLSVTTTVFPKFSSTKAGRDKSIVNVTWTGKEPPTITPFHRTEDMFLALLSRSLPHLVHDSGVRRLVPRVTTASPSMGSRGAGVDMLNALLFTGIGNVFLKEFRDSLNPAAACYQAVCKTDTIPAQFKGGGCVDDPGKYKIRIADVASEPLRTYLKESGLYREDAPAEFAYVLNLDLELTAGRVIANPMALDGSPDVSLRSTALKVKEGQRRVRRVATSSECKVR